MVYNPCLLNQSYILLADTFGISAQIYRIPDFTAVDQTPELVGTQNFKFTPGGGPKYAVPYLPGPTYFTITGNRFNFQPGDILVPVDSEFPPITVLNYDYNMPCIGFRSSRIANVNLSYSSDGTQNSVYTNVYFDWCAPTSPTGGLIDQLSEALGVSNKKVVMWTRINLQPQNNDALVSGWRIQEIDGLNAINLQPRWVVKSLTQQGNLTIFNIDNNPAGV
jgi:hypothetical protein